MRDSAAELDPSNHIAAFLFFVDMRSAARTVTHVAAAFTATNTAAERVNGRMTAFASRALLVDAVNVECRSSASAAINAIFNRLNVSEGGVFFIDGNNQPGWDDGSIGGAATALPETSGVENNHGSEEAVDGQTRIATTNKRHDTTGS